MKLSTTFLKAAELVASDEVPYTCDAILAAHKGRAPGAMFWWRDHFKPSLDAPETYWLRGTGMTKQERIEWRILALCFAAAICKSEGI